MILLNVKSEVTHIDFRGSSVIWFHIVGKLKLIYIFRNICSSHILKPKLLWTKHVENTK